MQRYLVRRLLITLVTILAVTVIVFIMGRAAGDPRNMMIGALQAGDNDQWEELGKKFGLDKPYYQQYGIFLKDLVQGDLGRSILESRPTTEVIGERLGATFELGLAAFLFAAVVGIPLGVLGAVKRGGILDQIGRVLALIGQSAPTFWLGLMLMFIFSVRLDYLPPSGRNEWTGVILPAVTLGWFFIAINMRLIRSAMLDVLDSEYIRLARAKGVPGIVIIWKHALRNALIPAFTFAGVNLGNVVAGALTVELVFAWPGLGRLAVIAMLNNDYPLLQGVVIVYTLLFVGASLLVDILYAYIDPRIRLT